MRTAASASGASTKYLTVPGAPLSLDALHRMPYLTPLTTAFQSQPLMVFLDVATVKLAATSRQVASVVGELPLGGTACQPAASAYFVDAVLAPDPDWKGLEAAMAQAASAGPSSTPSPASRAASAPSPSQQPPSPPASDAAEEGPQVQLLAKPTEDPGMPPLPEAEAKASSSPEPLPAAQPRSAAGGGAPAPALEAARGVQRLPGASQVQAMSENMPGATPDHIR
ncbi:hypothetical protein ABPG75_008257 [Micractinium tetrahymenae]